MCSNSLPGVLILQSIELTGISGLYTCVFTLFYIYIHPMLKDKMHYVKLLIFNAAYDLCETGCSSVNSYCANFTHHQCVNNTCICRPKSSNDNCCKYELFV